MPVQRRRWRRSALLLCLYLSCPAAILGQQPSVAPLPVLHGTSAEPDGYVQPPPPPSPYAGPAVVDPAWFAEPAPPCRSHHPHLAAWLHRHGLHCWSDFTLPICPNGRSNWDFVFGSCKTFFGEPCLSCTPLVPVPPGYEPFPYGRR
jgi:hypothetical protein